MRVGDSDIDTMIKNAWRGLDKVYNANNALAMKDYLEALPFMPHLGSVLSRYGKGILKSLKSNSFRVPGTRRILPGE